jgi:hypothetical protein
VPHFQPIDNSYNFNIEADAKEMIEAAKFREKINLWLAICPLFKEYRQLNLLFQIVIIIFMGGGLQNQSEYRFELPVEMSQIKS